MPYAIGYSPSGYIHLKFTSPDSLEEHSSAVADIHRLIGEHDCLNVVVDLYEMNEKTRLDRADQFSFTQAWDPKIVEGCRFAVILPARQEFQDDWYFITHFIKESGTIGQPFYERLAAIKWISGD